MEIGRSGAVDNGQADLVMVMVVIKLRNWSNIVVSLVIQMHPCLAFPVRSTLATPSPSNHLFLGRWC